MILVPRRVVYSDAVNSQDHGALVAITLIVCAACSTVFFAIRLLIRWPWRNTLGKDDCAATAATLLAFVQIALIGDAISNGMGRTDNLLPSDAVHRIEKTLYASNLLYVLVICLSQLSVSLLFSRLSGSVSHFRWSAVISISSCICGCISVLVTAIQPPYASPWTLGAAEGQSQMSRWIVVETISVAVDVCIMLFPVYLVRGLQMRVIRKWKVIITFQTRALVIAFVILRLLYLSFLTQSRNSIFDYARVEMLTQARMCFTVVSATIPCLQIFFRDARTGLLGGNVVTADVSNVATFGSAAHKVTTSATVDSATETPIQLRNLSGSGTTRSLGVRSDRLSATSDYSERANIVKPAADLQFC